MTAPRDEAVLKLWSALKGATYPVFSRLGQTMEATGATPGQMAYLHTLASEEEGLTPQAVARCLDVTPATVTEALNRLEEQGWLERLRESDDRRVVTIRITAAGRGLVKRWRETFVDELRKFMAPLTEEEIATVVRLLAKLGPPIVGPPGGFAALLRKDAGPATAPKAKAARRARS